MEMNFLIIINKGYARCLGPGHPSQISSFRIASFEHFSLIYVQAFMYVKDRLGCPITNVAFEVS